MPFGLPILFAALLAGLFTWLLTAVGAAVVFFIVRINDRIMSIISGVAAGIMLSASFWSLLLPAKELCEAGGRTPVLPLCVGFLVGGLFIVLSGLFFERVSASGMGFHPKAGSGGRWGSPRSVLIILAITMHNIPEGLAVGVAFGAAAGQPELLPAALALTLGIGLQNIPEGAAVALPLRREGVGRGRSFFFGQLSAAVEPLAALLGASLSVITAILPFALAFAAGAMVFVVAQELIPEAVQSSKWGVCALMLGFSLMTMLDVMF